MELNAQTVKKIIKDELPNLVRKDKILRKYVLDISKKHVMEVNEKTGKLEAETTGRFDIVLEELRKDREEQARRWDENQEKLERMREESEKKWDEHNRKWEENQKELQRMREESERKWDEQNRKWDESQEKLDMRWKEQEKQWNITHKEINKLYKMIKRHDSSLSAVGARWGVQSEASFRNALKGILKELSVQVMNLNEYDKNGEVFGYPADVEIDLIIINGILLLSEIKSSVSISDMFTFQKKAIYFQKIRNRKADHLVVISPMVTDKAREVADYFGIKIYSYVEDMEGDISSFMQ